MNPRTLDIANTVDRLQVQGLAFDRAVRQVADILDISPDTVVRCHEIATCDDPDGYYDSECEPEYVNPPLTPVYVPTDEDWRTLNSDPRYGNEFGSVSVGTLLFCLAALLAVLYVLT